MTVQGQGHLGGMLEGHGEQVISLNSFSILFSLPYFSKASSQIFTQNLILYLLRKKEEEEEDHSVPLELSEETVKDLWPVSFLKC